MLLLQNAFENVCKMVTILFRSRMCKLENAVVEFVVSQILDHIYIYINLWNNSRYKVIMFHLYPHHKQHDHWDSKCQPKTSLIARLMWPTWGPPGADRSQVGPILAPWILLSSNFYPLNWGNLKNIWSIGSHWITYISMYEKDIWVGLQWLPLKFHKKYLTHTWKDMIF